MPRRRPPTLKDFKGMFDGVDTKFHGLFYGRSFTRYFNKTENEV